MIDKTSEDLAEDYTIWQLKDSEYPEPIYEILFKHLTALAECTPNVARRKLRYLEGIVINRSFFMNQVTIP